jgi:hypothetical protein
MLAAFALDWTTPADADPFPVAAATVYLRVRRHGSAHQVSDEELSIGYRATVIESAAELPDLLALTDRALTRARRHAAILAGHQLGDDLTRAAELSTIPLRGAAGVLAGWANRSVKERGMALMVDTAAEARAAGADLDMPLEPLTAPLPHNRACCAELARTVLSRCLAIGLTAAVHTGRYGWEGTFRVTDAIDTAAWDVLNADTSTSDHDRPTADPAASPQVHATA